jgi:hypothetical protein
VLGQAGHAALGFGLGQLAVVVLVRGGEPVLEFLGGLAVLRLRGQGGEGQGRDHGAGHGGQDGFHVNSAEVEPEASPRQVMPLMRRR